MKNLLYTCIYSDILWYFQLESGYKPFSFHQRLVNCETVFLLLCICNSVIQQSKRQS